MSPGNRPSPGNRSNRFSGIAQLILGSDFGKIFYICDISSGKVGKGPWEFLLELSQENIWLDPRGLGWKYMYRSGQDFCLHLVVKI